MNITLRILGRGALVLILTGSGLAATLPGRWEKVESLAEGRPITVFLKAGNKIEGSFLFINDTALAVGTEQGRILQIPRSEVARILTVSDSEDSTGNGALIGAAAGFGIGFLSAVLYEKSVTASGFRLAEENLALALLAGGLGSGVGTLTGWAIDKSIRSSELIYVSP